MHIVPYVITLYLQLCAMLEYRFLMHNVIHNIEQLYSKIDNSIK